MPTFILYIKYLQSFKMIGPKVQKNSASQDTLYQVWQNDKLTERWNDGITNKANPI